MYCKWASCAKLCSGFSLNVQVAVRYISDISVTRQRVLKYILHFRVNMQFAVKYVAYCSVTEQFSVSYISDFSVNMHPALSCVLYFELMCKLQYIL